MSKETNPVVQVVLNGQTMALSEARVAAMDAGLLLGAGLFETLRAANGRIFRPGDHLERLFKSAEALEIPVVESADQLAEYLAEALVRNGLQEARCRITVTRGPLPSESGQGNEARPTCLVTAGVLTEYPEELYQQGMTVTISDVRVNPTDPLSGHKTTNYLTNLIVLREAHARGGHESLRFNGPGRLGCGAISNVFVVRGNRVLTPPVSEGCLPGITRKVVLELAERLGIEALEEPIEAGEVLQADEIFLTNTMMGVMPVCRIERHAIGDEKPGEMTVQLMNAYNQLLMAETTGSQG